MAHQHSRQTSLSAFVSGVLSSERHLDSVSGSARELVDEVFSVHPLVRSSSIRGDRIDPLGESVTFYYEVVDDSSPWKEKTTCRVSIFRQNPNSDYLVEGSLPGGYRKFRGRLEGDDQWVAEVGNSSSPRSVAVGLEGLSFIFSLAKLNEEKTA